MEDKQISRKETLEVIQYYKNLFLPKDLVWLENLFLSLLSYNQCFSSLDMKAAFEIHNFSPAIVEAFSFSF